MEHSALHAVQLVGLILTLSGPLFVLGLVDRSYRALPSQGSGKLYAVALRQRAAAWVFYGALAAACATGADLFVQTAELTGRTVFAGVDLQLLGQFAAGTNAGRLALARLGLMLAITILARRANTGEWLLMAALGLTAMVSTSLVSHAAAQPAGRSAAILTQVSHLCGAAAWLGVLMHLLAARPLIEASDETECVALTADIVRRFSPIALSAAALLMISGLLAITRFAGNVTGLFTSAYGLTLLVKLALLVLVVWAGSINFRLVRPALLDLVGRRSEVVQAGIAASGINGGKSILRKFGRLLELEVTAGLLVITVAGVVGSISPPAGPGRQQLTIIQRRALLSPHWPRTNLPDPGGFYGAPERTLEDCRYSEFTHNWSGVAVALLGCCWLAQSVGSRFGGAAARVWPWLLLALGIFIAGVSDPELWLLRCFTFWDVLGNPQVLEHQLGAAMVFLLAWFAWRDRLRKRETRPLGYVLPTTMICGSLLLLGHAHSNLNAGQELTSLINVQHAVLGALGLFAGTVRWLGLRGLMPQTVARWAWACLVIALGLFMAFFYREAI